MSYSQVERRNTRQEGSDGQPGRRAQAWLLARGRSVPDVLSQAPSWVRDSFDQAWAATKAMARQLRCLPPDLWGYLLRTDGGFVAICTGDSHYAPGAVTLRNELLRNVAFVAVEDLALDNDRPLHVMGHLIDHYLGCGGEYGGQWLSGGGGVSALWQEAGQRLSGLFALGYGVDEIAQSNVRDYFAQSLALYCRDRERLNIADPRIDKWLRSTLWSPDFWRPTRSGEA
jgi:hypothetical protein